MAGPSTYYWLLSTQREPVFHKLKACACVGVRKGHSEALLNGVVMGRSSGKSALSLSESDSLLRSAHSELKVVPGVKPTMGINNCIKLNHCFQSRPPTADSTHG